MTDEQPDRDHLGELPSWISPDMADHVAGELDWLARMRADALITEAEDAAHGIRYLSVEHGEIETSQDAELHQALTDAAWKLTGHGGLAVLGGHGYTAFRIWPPHADDAVAELDAVARRLNPGWWHVRLSAR